MSRPTSRAAGSASWVSGSTSCHMLSRGWPRWACSTGSTRSPSRPPSSPTPTGSDSRSCAGSAASPRGSAVPQFSIHRLGEDAVRTGQRLVSFDQADNEVRAHLADRNGAALASAFTADVDGTDDWAWVGPDDHGRRVRPERPARAGAPETRRGHPGSWAARSLKPSIAGGRRTLRPSGGWRGPRPALGSTASRRRETPRSAAGGPVQFLTSDATRPRWPSASYGPSAVSAPSWRRLHLDRVRPHSGQRPRRCRAPRG
jgi:hypothetical protein